MSNKNIGIPRSSNQGHAKNVVFRTFMVLIATFLALHAVPVWLLVIVFLKKMLYIKWLNSELIITLLFVFSTRSLRTPHSESSMEVISVFMLVTNAVNVGISLLMEQNAVDPCQLKEHSTWGQEVHRISFAIVILKASATKSQKAKYVLESG